MELSLEKAKNDLDLRPGRDLPGTKRSHGYPTPFPPCCLRPARESPHLAGGDRAILLMLLISQISALLLCFGPCCLPEKNMSHHRGQREGGAPVTGKKEWSEGLFIAF